MEMQEALVIWCEFDYHPKTARIPDRIRLYLEEQKPVYYVPSDTAKMPSYFPLGEIEILLSNENGMQDAATQHSLLLKKLKQGNITKVELCGPLADICLRMERDFLAKEGIEAQINMDYSAIMPEHVGSSNT